MKRLSKFWNHMKKILYYCNTVTVAVSDNYSNWLVLTTTGRTLPTHPLANAYYLKRRFARLHVFRYRRDGDIIGVRLTERTGGDNP